MSDVSKSQSNTDASKEEATHDFNDDYRLRVYETYRNRIQQEDNLISQRVTYLLTSQAFLLAPYILSYTSTVNTIDIVQLKARNNAARNSAQSLDNPIAINRLQVQQNAFEAIQTVVPIAGISSCAVTLLSVIAAVNAMSRAKEDYGRLKSVFLQLDISSKMRYVHIKCLPEDELRLVPPLYSSPTLHWLGFFSPFTFIAIVAAVWLFLLHNVALNEASPTKNLTISLLFWFLGAVTVVGLALLIYWAVRGWRRSKNNQRANELKKAFDKGIQEGLLQAQDKTK